MIEIGKAAKRIKERLEELKAMATSTVTVNGNEWRKPQKSLFDLDTMSTVTLVKPYEFEPVSDVKSALARIDNDTAKLVAIINRGLQSFQDEAVKADSNIPWKVEDEEGNLTDFTGTPADDKAVNALVLNMAKASFGYLKATDSDAKRASKQAALDFIKSQPVLIAGMKAQLENA
jgi:hypothetical protein